MAATSTSTFVLNDRTYRLFKNVVMYALPGLGTLYFTLASIWGLPYGEQVIGTLAAIATFLSIIIKFSENGYNSTAYDGELIEHGDEDGVVTGYTLAIDSPVSSMIEKDVIKFKNNTK